MSVQYTYSGGMVTILADGSATYTGTAPTYIGLFPVFTPPLNPDVGADSTEQPEIFVAKFGDGYSQRVPKGINYMTETMSVAWGLLTVAQRDVILTFFRTQAGYLPFWYQLPNGRLMRYICPGWKSVSRSPVLWSIQASFQRVYDAA